MREKGEEKKRRKEIKKKDRVKKFPSSISQKCFELCCCSMAARP
jgi:hypothetical protein